MLSLLYSSAWLTGYEHPVIDTINQRIEDLTGLEMDTAEELQVKSSLAECCKYAIYIFFSSYLFSGESWNKLSISLWMSFPSFYKPNLYKSYFIDLCRLQITVLVVNTNLILTLEGWDTLCFTQVNYFEHSAGLFIYMYNLMSLSTERWARCLQRAGNWEPHSNMALLCE